jgi:DNA-binding transcriptional LysR family regulator
VVLDFLGAYPDITVRMVLADHVVNLVDEHVDVALRIGALPDSSMMAVRLGVVGWVVCASPAYLAEKGVPETPEALAGHDCILFEGAYSGNDWRFRRGQQGVSLAVPFRFAVNTGDAAIAAATAGAGIVRMLSYQVAQAVAEGSLRLVLRAFETAPLPVHLVYAGQSLVPLKLRAFLDYAAPRLKDSLAVGLVRD